jgi:hypothetical protein
MFFYRFLFKNILIFSTFVLMKKTQSTRFRSFKTSRLNRLLLRFQRIVFSVKSFQNFEIFDFTNPLHEELQIIYANIRV